MTGSTDPTFGSTQSSSSGSATEQAATQIKEQAQQVAGQAQGRVQQVGEKAQGRARQEVDSRSTQAGEMIVSTSEDLRSVADSLREQGKEAPAKIAEQAAQQVEKVGSYLRDSDADRLLGDVEGFVRKQPWVVAVGGVLLGFAAARVLKASSGERYRLGQASGTGRPELGTSSSFELGYATPSYDYDVGAEATVGTTGTEVGTRTSDIGVTEVGVSSVGTSTDLTDPLAVDEPTPVGIPPADDDTRDPDERERSS